MKCKANTFMKNDENHRNKKKERNIWVFMQIGMKSELHFKNEDKEEEKRTA